MDGNEPVAESDGNFIGWVGSMLDPISRVVDQLTKVHGDSVSIDANVARRGAILSGPTPHFSEHAFVQLVPEILFENLQLPAHHTSNILTDIVLIGFITLLYQGDSRR